METFTVNSIDSLAAFIRSKRVLTILGTIPVKFGSLSSPCIVKVFPEPVWPYAKTVPLNPYRTPFKSEILTLNNWLCSKIINFMLMTTHWKYSIKTKIMDLKIVINLRIHRFRQLLFDLNGLLTWELYTNILTLL